MLSLEEKEVHTRMLRGNELKRVLRYAKVNREEKKSAFSSSFFLSHLRAKKKRKKNIGKRRKKRLSAYTCTYLREVKRHTHFFFSLFSAVAIAYVCVCVCFEACLFSLSFLRGKDERIEEAKSRCVRGESCVLHGLRVCLCHPSPTVQVPLQRTS